MIIRHQLVHVQEFVPEHEDEIQEANSLNESLRDPQYYLGIWDVYNFSGLEISGPIVKKLKKNFGAYNLVDQTLVVDRSQPLARQVADQLRYLGFYKGSYSSFGRIALVLPSDPEVALVLHSEIEWCTDSRVDLIIRVKSDPAGTDLEEIVDLGQLRVENSFGESCFDPPTRAFPYVNIFILP